MHTTPLHDWHVAHKARMVPFAGWDMPVQYPSGILAEHEQTRTRAALFDICHMGEFLVGGDQAEEALGRIVTHNLQTLRPGKCRYGFLLNTDGMVLDDLIVYRLAGDKFMLVVNAACREQDYNWLHQHLPASVHLEDISEATAKIDLQGPCSYQVLCRVLPENWHDLGYFSFRPSSYRHAEILVSRTGYTGELGYEIYLPARSALSFWEACLEDTWLKPAGLGARDTLRLEMGLPLYGQDLDLEHTPAEAGYAGLLTSPAAYIGKAGQLSIRERLTPLSIAGRRSARHHDPVATTSGRIVGRVTSGSFAPSLGHCVALAYIAESHVDEHNFLVQTGKTELAAQRSGLPFYTAGTARMKLEPDSARA
jgi:aminomethyltransferase